MHPIRAVAGVPVVAQAATGRAAHPAMTGQTVVAGMATDAGPVAAAVITATATGAAAAGTGHRLAGAPAAGARTATVTPGAGQGTVAAIRARGRTRLTRRAGHGSRAAAALVTRGTHGTAARRSVTSIVRGLACRRVRDTHRVRATQTGSRCGALVGAPRSAGGPVAGAVAAASFSAATGGVTGPGARRWRSPRAASAG